MIIEKKNVMHFFFPHYESIAIFIQKEGKSEKNIELVVNVMVTVIISKDLHLIQI